MTGNDAHTLVTYLAQYEITWLFEAQHHHPLLIQLSPHKKPWGSESDIPAYHAWSWGSSKPCGVSMWQSTGWGPAHGVSLQPNQTMHMRTATVLPLKPQPVVLCTKDVQVKALEELLESLVEKPVSYSWVVNDCTSAGTWRQVCRPWLSSSYVVSSSRNVFLWENQCSDRHNWKCANHVMQLIRRKACILRVLMNVDMTSLQYTPEHFSVEGEVPEASMPGKPTITIHHQMLQVVTKGDRVHAQWGSKSGSVLLSSLGKVTADSPIFR